MHFARRDDSGSDATDEESLTAGSPQRRRYKRIRFCGRVGCCIFSALTCPIKYILLGVVLPIVLLAFIGAIIGIVAFDRIDDVRGAVEDTATSWISTDLSTRVWRARVRGGSAVAAYAGTNAYAPAVSASIASAPRLDGWIEVRRSYIRYNVTTLPSPPPHLALVERNVYAGTVRELGRFPDAASGRPQRYDCPSVIGFCSKATDALAGERGDTKLFLVLLDAQGHPLAQAPLD